MKHDHHPHNRTKSRTLFSLLYLLLGMATWALGGPGFAFAVAVASIPFHILALRLSPALVKRNYQGRELTCSHAPKLKGILQTLARRADLEGLPQLLMVPGKAISAFTVGTRNNAAIALSHGLLENLDIREVAGVLAHEVTHLSHGDNQVMVLSGLLRRIIGLMTLLAGVFVCLNLPLFLLGKEDIDPTPLLVLLLAPTLGSLLMFSLSRSLEFSADHGAAVLLGDPEPLASALKKMGAVQKVPWWSCLLPAGRNDDHYLLRTHPTSRERIQHLRSMTLTSPFSPRSLFQETDISL